MILSRTRVLCTFLQNTTELELPYIVRIPDMYIIGRPQSEYSYITIYKFVLNKQKASDVKTNGLFTLRCQRTWTDQTISVTLNTMLVSILTLPVMLSRGDRQIAEEPKLSIVDWTQRMVCGTNASISHEL